MKLLFCNVGWMEGYKGKRDSKGRSTKDKIYGGGRYVNENKRGGEMCNFEPVNGVVYGYVQPRLPSNTINIDRLGADSTANSVSGITVVWTAKRPRIGSVVVGWYHNATVYRVPQRHNHTPPVHAKNGLDWYWVRARARDATLLNVDSRVVKVKRGFPGAMGNSNVWFADAPESAKFVKPIKALLKNGSPTRVNFPSRRGSNPKRNKLVENIAIELCTQHFEQQGYEVTSVESDNKGWDLEANFGEVRLRIEVKGLSGDAFRIELTPNEFVAFTARSLFYRLAVVVNAFSNPTLSICRYSEVADAWIVEGRSAIVQINERTAASVSF